MIKAKADNTELVVFGRYKSKETEWEEVSYQHLIGHENYQHFLCLPKHNENGQCLHWLNNGQLEFRRDGEEWQDEPERYHGWVDYCGMMNPDVEFRIKPRKEKRWVSVRKINGEVCQLLFDSKDEAEQINDGRWWSHHEIEIEIEV